MTGSTTAGKVISAVVVAAVAAALAIGAVTDGADGADRPPAEPRATTTVRAVPLDGGPAVDLDLALADDESTHGAVALDDAVLVAVTPDDRFGGRLVALDPATGEPVASAPVPDGATARVDEAVTWGDLVLVPLVGGPADGVVAVDRATGRVAWTSLAPGAGPEATGPIVRVEQVVVVDEATAAVVETVAEGPDPGTPEVPHVRLVDRTGATTATTGPLGSTRAPAGATAVGGELVVVLDRSAVAVRPDGTVGPPVALPLCPREASAADGDLLLVGTTGGDCSLESHEEPDVARVARVRWPAGTVVWEATVPVATVDRPMPRAVLVPERGGAVVALGADGSGALYATAALDPADGTLLWDRPGTDVVVGPGARAFALAVEGEPARLTLDPVDLRTGEGAGVGDGRTVDTGAIALPAGLTATHVVIEVREWA